MFPLQFKQPTKTMHIYEPQEFLNESGWGSGELVSHFGNFCSIYVKSKHVGNL